MAPPKHDWQIPSRPFLLCGVALVLVMVLLPQHAFAQSSDLFTEYLFGPTSAADGSKTRKEKGENLSNAIGTMTPAEIVAGLAVIDRRLDAPADPGNSSTQRDAAYLLFMIAKRLDGWDVLTSQIGRLTSMLGSPSDAFGFFAVYALLELGLSQPASVQRIFENALKEPDINKSSLGGAGIVGALLFMPTRNLALREPGLRGDVTMHVVTYMRRPDLTDTEVVRLIESLSRDVIRQEVTAPAIVNELIRYLDRPDDLVKTAALALIEKDGPLAKDAARSRVERMVSDPKESPAVRQSAAGVLKTKQ